MEATSLGYGDNGRAQQIHALIVSDNIATGIVAGAIVERCGLVARRLQMNDSLERIRKEKPPILIIDSSCGALIGQLDTIGAVRPYTIYLGFSSDMVPDDGSVDAFVCKPLTTEVLQPLIFEWIEANLNTGRYTAASNPE